MPKRENEKWVNARNKGLKYNAKEIVLAVNMIEKLEKTIDVVYYLMEHEGVESFVLMLMKADNIDLNTLLDREKRDTDILFEIDKEKGTNVLLCQDTKVDGGYHFAERVIKNILAAKGTNVYCSELEIRSTRHPTKNVIFKLIETFMRAQAENKTNEIVYKSLN